MKKKKDLEQIIQDKDSDNEITKMAEKDLEDLNTNKITKVSLRYSFYKRCDDVEAIVEIRAGTGGLEASLFCRFI